MAQRLSQRVKKPAGTAYRDGGDLATLADDIASDMASAFEVIPEVIEVADAAALAALDPAPKKGDLALQVDTSEIKIYDGAAWQDIKGGGSGAGGHAGLTINGGAGVTLAGDATDTVELTVGEQTATILLQAGGIGAPPTWPEEQFEFTRNGPLDCTVAFAAGNETVDEVVISAIWYAVRDMVKNGDFDVVVVPDFKGTTLVVPAGGLFPGVPTSANSPDFGEGLYVQAGASASWSIGVGIAAGIVVDP